MKSYGSHCRGDHHMWMGLIFFIIGAIILLQKFDIIPSTTWGWLWPAILVVIGLKFMLACSDSSCCDDSSDECCGMCDEKPMKKMVKRKKKKKAKKK